MARARSPPLHLSAREMHVTACSGSAARSRLDEFPPLCEWACQFIFFDKVFALAESLLLDCLLVHVARTLLMQLKHY